jgi:hypothetical protein
VKNANYAKLTTGLIFVWFLLSLAASAGHLFRTSPDQPPLPLGLAVLIPVSIFLAWAVVSQTFRKFLLSLNTSTLTYIQAWRIAGFVFLALYSYRILPGHLALPAGWGDIAIGITAPFVAMNLANPRFRRSFIFWQLLGITDLVTAVGMGVASGFINPHGIPTSAMTVLPMSLIPTFAVPLFMILHFICIAQARQWHEQRNQAIGKPLHSTGL